jgi:hypothetical protein
VTADLSAELVQARAVAGDGMVVEPTLDNYPQPLAHLRHRGVHEAVQPSFNLVQLRPHALGGGRTLDRKRPPPRLPALMREAQEGERFWLAQSTLGPAFSREATELQQTRLVRMQDQAELGETLPEFAEAAFGILTVLEPHDEIIRVPNDDDIAPCVVFSPVLSPEVEHVVEKYIR